MCVKCEYEYGNYIFASNNTVTLIVLNTEVCLDSILQLPGHLPKSWFTAILYLYAYRLHARKCLFNDGYECLIQ